jgi:dGTPase
MCQFKREDRELYPNPLATISTRGRKEDASPDSIRTPFQRDIHRIIYSQSFRRLRHKTQVFYFPQNDHVSTRLDHVLFVSAASRTVARALGFNEDLTEAIGLAHDIGHAPFGHQGEKFLQKIIDKHPSLKKILPFFHHEVYGLRVVDRIAKRDRESPGLNLTWEVRDGIVSHCGEDYKTCRLTPAINKADDFLDTIRKKDQAGFPATYEGCIVRLVDKVAYAGKDIEDAIATGIITEEQVPQDIRSKLGETNGKIIGAFLQNIVSESHNQSYIGISREYGKLLENMIQFNIDNIYHSLKSEKFGEQAERTIIFAI